MVLKGFPREIKNDNHLTVPSLDKLIYSKHHHKGTSQTSSQDDREPFIKDCDRSSKEDKNRQDDISWGVGDVMRIIDGRNDPHGEGEPTKTTCEGNTEIPVAEGEDGTKDSGYEPDPEVGVGRFEEEVDEVPTEDYCDHHCYHGPGHEPSQDKGQPDELESIKHLNQPHNNQNRAQNPITGTDDGLLSNIEDQTAVSVFHGRVGADVRGAVGVDFVDDSVCVIGAVFGKGQERVGMCGGGEGEEGCGDQETELEKERLDDGCCCWLRAGSGPDMLLLFPTPACRCCWL